MQQQLLQPPQASQCQPASWPHRRACSARRLRLLLRASANPGDQETARWYDSLNRRDVQAALPSPSFLGAPIGKAALEQPAEQVGMGESLMGEDSYRQWTEIKKGERQRVWDSMRAAAGERYARGEMPAWFDPRWLAQEESPINQAIREMGDPRYQNDDSWLGRSYDDGIPGVQPTDLALAGGGDDDSGAGGRRGPGGGGDGDERPWWLRWWREEDPYWMLRDWGSHPMRWWTLGFGGVLALGGLLAYVWHDSPESLLVGCGSAAALALCSLAMSDMRYGTHGELGVKGAWAICALLALKDGIQGWAHVPSSGTQRIDYDSPGAFLASQREPAPWDWLILRLPNVSLGGCGWASVALCGALMWTGMGGEVDGSLPMNPGAVYKSSDIVLKHRVWKRWGYEDATMRV